MQQSDFRTRRGEQPCRQGPFPRNHAKDTSDNNCSACPSKRLLSYAAQLPSNDAVGGFSKRLPSASFSSGARTRSKTSATAASWSGVAASTARSMAWRIAAAQFWRVLDPNSFLHLPRSKCAHGQLFVTVLRHFAGDMRYSFATAAYLIRWIGLAVDVRKPGDSHV